MPDLQKVVVDGIEFTFFGTDLQSLIDVHTGKPIEWGGTLHHDTMADIGLKALGYTGIFDDE